MIKKRIKFVDYNGTEREEDFYFHISRAEMVEQELLNNGTLEQKLKLIGASNDGALIVPKFKEIMAMAYGKRTPDGGFVKRPEYWEEFQSLPAYEIFLLELLESEENMSAFVNGIMPANLNEPLTSRNAPARPQDHRRKEIPRNVPTAPSGQVVADPVLPQGDPDLTGLSEEQVDLLSPENLKLWRTQMRNKIASPAVSHQDGMTRPPHEAGMVAPLDGRN